MLERHNVPLGPLTTLRLGGPGRTVLEPADELELIDAVQQADAAGRAVLLIGGGSNLVLADEGWPGAVVLLRTRGVDVLPAGPRVLVTAQAGEPWDELVALTVAEGWAGIEALSGIPGLTGATPVQNVGAYGQEVADTVSSVRVFDRQAGTVDELSPAQCGFGYRTSVFKGTDRYVVLDVTFALTPGQESAPIRYAELAKTLGVEVGGRAKTAEVREAVLALRRSKGMVLDAADHDTWSAGSFFTNPVLSPAELAAFDQRVGTESYPSWPSDEGTKLSAAWLIQHAGFDKGYGSGPAGLSTKHTLALTNRGAASTEDLLALAREVRYGVSEKYGVSLHPEPLLIGCAL